MYSLNSELFLVLARGNVCGENVLSKRFDSIRFYPVVRRYATEYCRFRGTIADVRAEFTPRMLRNSSKTVPTTSLELFIDGIERLPLDFHYKRILTWVVHVSVQENHVKTPACDKSHACHTTDAVGGFYAFL